MKFRYGTFSYLPDLTDEEIGAQVRYALDHGWPVSIEYTDDPHPRNIYWEMFGLPMFDLAEPDGVLAQINECRTAFPGHYIRVLAYDASLGRQSTAMSFLVQSPASEPGFLLERYRGTGPHPALRGEVVCHDQADRRTVHRRVI
jgi:ribulose-bisphosphate carboxylase small chain